MTDHQLHTPTHPARRDLLAFGVGATALAMLPGRPARARSNAASTPLTERMQAMSTVTTRFPHGMCATHADVVNPDLLAFVKR